MEHVPLCEGVKPNRDLCTRLGVHEIDGFHYCFQHLPRYNRAREIHGPRPAARCRVISRANNFCPFNCAPDELVCQRHLPAAEGGPQQEAHLLAGWRQDDIVRLLGDPNIFVRGFEDMQIDPIILQMPQVPRVVPFAADPQNVHRKEVSEQTNKATEFLLNVKLPAKNQNLLWRFAAAKFLEFAMENIRLFVDVIADVERWLNTDTCRKKDDFLYCKLLYALIMYIKKSEHANDLWKRLWEECCDSVGMCCEGHISRLCNVLVGYVEGLDAPVALGELMQQKMAAIAAQDIPEEDKKRMANEFFDTHGVPDAERVAWLDAF